MKNDYKDVFKSSTDEELLDHIKFLPNESDFEKYLIDQDYKEELLRIIDNIKGKESFIESYIEKNNGKKSKPKSTKRNVNLVSSLYTKQKLKITVVK
ncbi:hypothetical protein OE903_21110 [Bacillus sp. B6(2022)]|nr:hypothetical protein [Bacillus sp. B6(2022)]